MYCSQYRQSLYLRSERRNTKINGEKKRLQYVLRSKLNDFKKCGHIYRQCSICCDVTMKNYILSGTSTNPTLGMQFYFWDPLNCSFIFCIHCICTVYKIKCLVFSFAYLYVRQRNDRLDTTDFCIILLFLVSVIFRPTGLLCKKTSG